MNFNMNQFMKKMQKMQEELMKKQEAIKEKEVIGEAGGSLVKVTMNGDFQVKLIEIDDSIWNEDKEIILDLITAAVNNSVTKVKDLTQEQLSELTGGMNIPGLL